MKTKSQASLRNFIGTCNHISSPNLSKAQNMAINELETSINQDAQTIENQRKEIARLRNVIRSYHQTVTE